MRNYMGAAYATVQMPTATSAVGAGVQSAALFRELKLRFLRLGQIKLKRGIVPNWERGE